MKNSIYSFIETDLSIHLVGLVVILFAAASSLQGLQV